MISHLLRFLFIPASEYPKLKGILLFLLTKSMFLLIFAFESKLNIQKYLPYGT